MTDLAGLIERLEGASGPDREIDAALMVALGGARRVDEFNFYGPNEEHWSFGDHEDENGAWCIHKPGPKKRLWEKRGCGMKEFCVSALDRGHSTISRWNDMSGVIQIYGDKYGR